MKNFLFLCCMALLLCSCSNSSQQQPEASGVASKEAAKSTTESGNPSYDPNRGEGKFTKVEIAVKLDVPMAESGKKAFDVKCSSCHKTTEEKLVGPGWKGVTSRHSAEWIMNFVTNTDQMIDKDPKAQAMLELCLVRMPNQNLSDVDARSLYEYMRRIDGVK